MEYTELGKTGIRVSRLCFGALTMGPLQAGLLPEAARWNGPFWAWIANMWMFLCCTSRKVS